MRIKDEIRKMPVSLDADNNVLYQLSLFNSEKGEAQEISLNSFIGKNINIHFTGNIFCIRCGKKIKKTFNQGFCYDCFMKAPEAAECIIRPELCRAHLGEGRDPEWEQKNHNQPHFVYFAATDIVKVGVTRSTQIPTRWIDQGAAAAIKLAETPNRYEAGLIEVGLKDSFTDKTNWRKMLTNQMDESIDLVEEKWNLVEQLPQDLTTFITEEDTVTSIHYPVLEYPSKVKSINLDKTPLLSGKLIGIRGQYLYLEEGNVLNIRKHSGYQVEFEFS